MLIKAKTLKGYKLDSKDGEVGKVKEFYFDDKHWTIRYLVADTGNWLTGRQVLISPLALISVNKEEELIGVNLTKKQIENSPSLNSDKPVSQQFEEDLHGYYGWPTYWSGSNIWGDYPYIIHDNKEWKASNQNKKEWDRNLRSSSFVTGQKIEATDGELSTLLESPLHPFTEETRTNIKKTKTIFLSAWAKSNCLFQFKRGVLKYISAIYPFLLSINLFGFCLGPLPQPATNGFYFFYGTGVFSCIFQMEKSLGFGLLPRLRSQFASVFCAGQGFVERTVDGVLAGEANSSTEDFFGTIRPSRHTLTFDLKLQYTRLIFFYFIK